MVQTNGVTTLLNGAVWLGRIELICKICNRKQHSCSCCDLEDWQYTYCSKNCYEQSEEFKSLNLQIKKLKNGLTTDQKVWIAAILENDFFKRELLNYLEEYTDVIKRYKEVVDKDGK